MEAIVLAGGLGTRLATKLSGIPKAMAPIGDRPFLEILLGQLKGAGCTRVILAVGYLREKIIGHFGGSFDGIRVDYAIEEVPLGTGGAICKALTMAEEKQALVLNGDTFLEADYAEMMRYHQAAGARMTIAISWQENVARFGGVLVAEQRIVGFEEKSRVGPGWINAGAYVVPKDLEWPARLPEKFSFEIDVLVPEVGRFNPAAYESGGFFLDIGVPEDLERAQTELMRY
jgi:D-glycero-alpha-D-manno-heptose 1-phosphate guanylyltransferase